MAYSPKLTSAVLRCFIAAVTSDLRRRARKRKLRGDLATGALTVIQRFGTIVMGTLRGFPNLPRRFAAGKAGRLRTRWLNVHFHTLALDGMYTRQPDGKLLFHPLPAPSDEDVARIARAVCRKVHGLLARQKDNHDGQTTLLDELANASVQGLVATGPRRGCRVLRLSTTGDDADADATIPSRRCADVAGFNVHANTCARANERERLEHLVKYLARPPIASDRLSELPDGRLALKFKQAWRDGTTHIVLTPHELIEKLIPLIPLPRLHLVRYSGVFAPASPWRPLVIPQAEPAPVATPETPAAPSAPTKPPRTGPRCRYWPWAELMRLTLGLPVDRCPHCGGRMKLRALVRDRESIERFLRHQNLWTEPLGLAQARPPPYFRSVTRLKPTSQVELFE